MWVKSIGSEVKILDRNLSLTFFSLMPPIWRIMGSTSVSPFIVHGRDEKETSKQSYEARWCTWEDLHKECHVKLNKNMHHSPEQHPYFMHIWGYLLKAVFQRQLASLLNSMTRKDLPDLANAQPFTPLHFHTYYLRSLPEVLSLICPTLDFPHCMTQKTQSWCSVTT